MCSKGYGIYLLGLYKCVCLFQVISSIIQTTYTNTHTDTKEKAEKALSVCYHIFSHYAQQGNKIAIPAGLLLQRLDYKKKGFS